MFKKTYQFCEISQQQMLPISQDFSVIITHLFLFFLQLCLFATIKHFKVLIYLQKLLDTTIQYLMILKELLVYVVYTKIHTMQLKKEFLEKAKKHMHVKTHL